MLVAVRLKHGNFITTHSLVLQNEKKSQQSGHDYSCYSGALSMSSEEGNTFTVRAVGSSWQTEDVRFIKVGVYRGDLGVWSVAL